MKRYVFFFMTRYALFIQATDYELDSWGSIPGMGDFFFVTTL
jgi:hypothetical protein